MDTDTTAQPVEPELDDMAEEKLDDLNPEGEESTTLLTWQTSEPEAPARDTSWYIIMGLIAAAIIIVAIITQTWLFIPVGLLAPIALTMYGNKGPGTHSYSLESFVVRVDDKQYSYDNFRAFFVIEDNGHVVFELIPLQRLGTLVTLHAAQDMGDEILEILASVLPETEPQGYLGESIFRRLKF